MRVDITAAALASEDPLPLLGLFSLALEERHRVFVEDDEELARWEPMQVDSIRDSVELAIDLSTEAEALMPQTSTIRVVPGTARWGRTPELSASAALDVLARPLRILLENGESDRAFILAFADRATRRYLEQCELRGWILFESGGGIEGLNQRLSTLRTRPADTLRLFVVADSDRLHRGPLAGTPRRLQSSLRWIENRYFGGRVGSMGRVLGRREAENYAPPRELLTFTVACSPIEGRRALQDLQVESPHRMARACGRQGTPRRRTLAARMFRDLPDEARDFLDMKHGRNRGEMARTHDRVWNGLSNVQKAALRHGFGAGFVSGFYGQSNALPDSSGEVVSIISTVMEIL